MSFFIWLIVLGVMQSYQSFSIVKVSRSSNSLMMSVKVALTREIGHNNKLGSLLHDCEVLEIPCIEFAAGEDCDKLPSAILEHDLIVITSPQASNVFVSVWESLNNKPLNLSIATVGKGTSQPLIKVGITPCFEPSDATAETLALELPTHFGNKVLYPTSSIAKDTLLEGLESRGFKVIKN